jgi:hypothetical protein
MRKPTDCSQTARDATKSGREGLFVPNSYPYARADSKPLASLQIGNTLDLNPVFREHRVHLPWKPAVCGVNLRDDSYFANWVNAVTMATVFQPLQAQLRLLSRNASAVVSPRSHHQKGTVQTLEHVSIN